MILEKKKLFLIKTSGTSMYPFIEDGDILLIKKILYTDLRVGNIILYEDDESREKVAHRIIKKIKHMDSVYTGGDASYKIQGPILSNKIIGVVIGITKNGKLKKIVGWKYIFFNWLLAKIFRFFNLLYRKVFLIRRIILWKRIRYLRRILTM